MLESRIIAQTKHANTDKTIVTQYFNVHLAQQSLMVTATRF